MSQKAWLPIVLVSVSFYTTVFAASVEVKTYYPSPYGEYENLTTTQKANFAIQSGRVGVGTTTPVAKLQVFGGIRAKSGLVTGDMGDAGYSFENDGDTGMFREGAHPYSNGNVVFRIDSHEYLRLANSGTVGVKVATPTTSVANPNGGARTIRMEVDESMLVDDVYLRSPTFDDDDDSSTGRWATQKVWEPGESCGIFVYGPADGVDANIPCKGVYIFKLHQSPGLPSDDDGMDNSGNFQCPSGFQKAGGDYQSPENRYLWTCIKT